MSSIKPTPVVTIDGPGGSGKGTISRLLAQRLGWHMLDSGALYRLTALAALNKGLALDDEAAVARIALHLPVEFVTDNRGEAVILLSGQDVTQAIRTEQVGNAASKVAALPKVRAALLERQRAFRQAPGLVADGRDMGTVVFADAGVKIFLTASAEERARRRYNQLKEQGISVNLAALVQEIAERDERDSNRSVAPLKPASDAVVVDTSLLSIDQVIDQVYALCKGC